MAASADAGEQVWKFVAEFAARFPQRHLGFPGMREAAAALEQAWRSVPGMTVESESFTARGGGFLGWLHPAVLLYLAGCVALAFRSGWSAAACFLLILGWGGGRFILYWRWPDRLFRLCSGWNVTGRIEPAGTVSQLVILAAHWDAALVFRWIETAPCRYACRVALAGAAPVCGVLAAGAVIADMAFWWSLPAWCGAAAVAPVWRFLDDRRCSPGAGDNLAGVGVVREIAREIACAPLRHTRVITAAFDGEECGLLGAFAWRERHAGECREIPVYVLNFDTVYRCETLSVLRSDRNGLIPLSGELAALLEKVAERQGIPLSEAYMPFGGGATDAAVFA